MLSVKYWRSWLKQKLGFKAYISFDIETTGLDIYKDQIHFCTYEYKGKKGLIEIRPDLVKKPFIPKEIRKALESEDVAVIIHSSQFDAPFWRLKTGIHVRNIWDTAITEQVILAGKYKRDVYTDTSLANCLKRRKIAILEKETRETFINYFGPITERQKKYGLKDISFLHKLALAQMKDIKRLELENTVKLENFTCEVTAELRYNGIMLDEMFWMDLADETAKEYKRRIDALPKSVTNWNSPPQIKKYFKSKHGIVIQSLSDLPNVKNKVLDQFKQARELYKSSTSYGYNFLLRGKKKNERRATVDGDSRIRCNYNQIMETGRYSTSNPNLQNLPAKGKHRNAFIPRDGFRFVVGDFEGQELGVMAAGSGEEWWIETLLGRKDLHSVLATKLYTDWEEVGEKDCVFPKKCSCPEHKKRRRPAKDLNFGIAYGKGWESFGIAAGLEPREAKRLFYKYKKLNPTLNRWLEGLGNEAIREGCIRTLEPFRRLRFVEGEDWKKRNRGKNTPVQGSGADMMKLAMCMMYKYIYDNNLQDKVRMVLTVHDELICEVKRSYCKAWVKAMKFFMEEAGMFITRDLLVTANPEIMDYWKTKD